MLRGLDAKDWEADEEAELAECVCAPGPAPCPPRAARPRLSPPPNDSLSPPARRLKTMFASPKPLVKALAEGREGGKSWRTPNSRSPGANNVVKPAWDSSTFRSRPPALRGLNALGSHEPWAHDENVYNFRLEMRDVGVQDRYEDRTARARGNNYRSRDYMARFDQKYAMLGGRLDQNDGNPFT